MNILHLLSQKELTGAEVYASTLIDQQISSGHRVFQISNGFFKTNLAQQISLPVETTSIIEFGKSVLFLRNFLQQNKIHVVHTHSRAAVKLVFYARLGLKIAVVSSVHGRQHISFSKKWFNQYGDFIVPVCDKIADQLKNEFKYNARRIKTIANPIDHRKFFASTQKILDTSKPLSIAIIGRTSGPKKHRTEVFIEKFSEILKQKSIAFEITLIGGDPLILKTITPLKSESHTGLNSQILQRFDLIVGSGRVSMEALMSAVPCIAFGESQYIGLITEMNLSDAASTNFGDIGSNFNLPTFNATQAYKDIELWLSQSVDYLSLSKTIQETYSLPVISKKIERIYESAYFLINYNLWIPILMYHKVPDQDLKSQHKVFVNKDNFEKHLQFFKKSGLTTLTFDDLSLFRKGLKDWSTFPRHPLILTFDDGYEDNISNADALLKKYNMKAQIFILADKNVSSNEWDYQDSNPADKHDIVSAENRQQWIKTNFTIGSHGIKHQRMPAMNRKEKMYELTESKRLLENEFGYPVISFAYTYGDTDEESAECTELAGYDYGVNTDTGGLLIEENPYSIFRVNIFPHEDAVSLWKKTRWWYRQYYFYKRKK